MSIIRTCHNKSNPYTLINKNTLEIEKLSWEAKGVWAYLMSRKDDWITRVSHLCKHFPGGRDRMRRILKELEEFGLAERKPQRNENGQWDSAGYVIYETPQELKKCLPGTENAGPENAGPENAGPYKVLSEINTEYNKEILSKESTKKVAHAPSPLSFSKEVSDLCELLVSRIESHGIKMEDPRKSKKTWINWLQTIDRMIRIDAHSVEEVKKMINYAHDNDFWCQNILSPQKLRKNWSQMAIQKAKQKLKPEERPEHHKALLRKIIKKMSQDSSDGKLKGVEKLHMVIDRNELVVGHKDSPHHHKHISFSSADFLVELKNFLGRFNAEKYLT